VPRDVGACTPSAGPDRAPSTRDTGPLPSESTPPATSRITLTLELSEPPVEWREVTFLPAGDADDQIGIDRCYHCEAVTPAALAIGPDGSYWIGDTVKHRIAHFAQDGSFLGSTRASARRTWPSPGIVCSPSSEGEVAWSRGCLSTVTSRRSS
jgi:hypothetical protein